MGSSPKTHTIIAERNVVVAATEAAGQGCWQGPLPQAKYVHHMYLGAHAKAQLSICFRVVASKLPEILP